MKKLPHLRFKMNCGPHKGKTEHTQSRLAVIEPTLSAPPLLLWSSWQAVWLRPIVKGAVFSGTSACVWCVRMHVSMCLLGPQTGRKRVGPAAQLQNSGFVFLLFPSVQSRVLKKQSLIFSALNDATLFSERDPTIGLSLIYSFSM